MLRNVVLLFIPWALIVIGLGVLLRDHLVRERIGPLERAQQAALEEGEIALTRRLALIRGNLTFLSQQPLLRSYLDTASEEDAEALSGLLSDFVQTTESYRHVKLFDAAGAPALVVGSPVGVSNLAVLFPDTLAEVTSMPWGSVALTGFLPGIATDTPFPELFLATPVFDSTGVRKGSLSLGYRSELIAIRLQEIEVNYSVPIGLMAEDGEWIFPPTATVAREGSEVVAERLKGAERGLALEGEPGSWVVERYDPQQILPADQGDVIGAPRWFLVSLLPAEALQAIHREVFWLVAIMAGAMLVTGLIVVVLLSRAEGARDRAMRALATRSDELSERNLELNRAVEALHKTQSALVQAEKLSSLGTLVAGVAHELNTPIGAASMASSALLGDAKNALAALDRVEDAQVRRFIKRGAEGLNIIQTNLDRLAQFTRAFKKLASDRASTERREFNLAELLDEVILVLGPRLKGTPHVIVHEVPRDLRLNSYPGPISQILQNLIDNALVHAFEPGVSGHVRVVAQRQGDHVRIEVSDDGSGMEPRQMASIFDPFFTTRRGRGGTGLGLHIIHQLTVNVLGGRIDVESTVGQGSRFCLEFDV
ncbi:sensor histidine kinase [Pseudomonas sp. Marseille-QA0892]